MTPLANLSAADLRRAADIKETIEALEKELIACLGGYTGSESRQARGMALGRKQGNTRGGKTVAACILEALARGGTVGIKEIAAAATKIRGKAISPMMMSYTLAQMKKAGQVRNPERGQYRKA